MTQKACKKRVKFRSELDIQAFTPPVLPRLLYRLSVPIESGGMPRTPYASQHLSRQLIREAYGVRRIPALWKSVKETEADKTVEDYLERVCW